VRAWFSLLALLGAGALAGCISVGLGGEPSAQVNYQLRDPHLAATARRDEPLVATLLIQPLPGDALADTLAVAYSRRPNEFSFYQFAFWTERPVRQLPRTLQQRLEARHVVGAVGVVGDPLRADWLLTISVDTLHHDVSVSPGQARFALTAELFERRSRTRIARHQFSANVPVAQADSAAATVALSESVAQAFDELLPWLEGELQRAAAAAPAAR